MKKDWADDYNLVTGIHDIIPMNDLEDHFYGMGCFCKPTKDELDDRIIKHHSLDGREEYEKIFYKSYKIN